MIEIEKIKGLENEIQRLEKELPNRTEEDRFSLHRFIKGMESALKYLKGELDF